MANQEQYDKEKRNISNPGRTARPGTYKKQRAVNAYQQDTTGTGGKDFYLRKQLERERDTRTKDNGPFIRFIPGYHGDHIGLIHIAALIPGRKKRKWRR